MTQFKNFIGGEWVDGNDSAPNVNPSDTSDVIGHFARASADQTQTAIASARSAFRTWSFSTPQQRFDLLDQVGSTILARKNELGKLLAREEGKTLAEAVGEVGRAGQIFKFFAGEALRVGGEIVPSVRPGLTVEVTREPLGVIGLITPWNFPIAIPPGRSRLRSRMETAWSSSRRNSCRAAYGNLSRSSPKAVHRRA